MKKGPLVKVEIPGQPGRFRKMYEADAIAAGHLKAKAPAENKMQPQPANKMRLPEEDKEPAPADDFTIISGVGPATARALAAHGITTFEQLREAENLDYLTDSVKSAIEEWKVG